MRKQRSVKTCAELTKDESLLQDQIKDFQAEKFKILTKYPIAEARKMDIAQLYIDTGITQDRRERKLILYRKTKQRL